jgi:hypothetical protein
MKRLVDSGTREARKVCKESKLYFLILPSIKKLYRHEIYYCFKIFPFPTATKKARLKESSSNEKKAMTRY